MSSARPPFRALIVTDYYRPLIGGSIRSVELLARHLTSRGHTVEIATAWQPELPGVEQIGGIRVHRIRDLTSRMRWVSEDPYKHNAPPFADPEAAWRLRLLIRRLAPDLVHTYGWLSHSVAAALIGLPVPLLLSARDYGNVCALGTLLRNSRVCSGPTLGRCLPCAARRYGRAKGAAAVGGVFTAGPMLRRNTTEVHAVSRFVATIMDRCLRVPNAPAVVIPNFHEDESGPPDHALLARLPSEPFILYAGAFREIKGIRELLAAYETLDDPPPLVLAGTRMTDTPERFPSGITVLTDVPYATLMAMWDRALFGVSPSVAPEALGNVVHEAMARGVAMIGTYPGGHADMIEDGVNGLLVPSGDAVLLAAAMARLIDDVSLRGRLARAARAAAARFTPEVVMPALEALYYETIDRGRLKTADGDEAR